LNCGGNPATAGARPLSGSDDDNLAGFQGGSSSSSFTSGRRQKLLLGGFDEADGLLALHGWELEEEVHPAQRLQA
jgi:hypothetical protein